MDAGVLAPPLDPAHTFTAFLIAVLRGAQRFAHVEWLRGDSALRALLGMERFATDDTIRNLSRRFGMGEVQRLFAPLWEWRMERLPRRPDGYTLDLDRTVFERYGHQQGSLKGHNPRKHGRPSHHPLLGVVAEAHFLLHGWGRSGTAEQHVELWNLSKKLLHCGDSAEDPPGKS